MRFKHRGAWQTITWDEYRNSVRAAARGLISLGFEAGDGLVILAPNRPEWVIADLAAIAAGGVPTGLYTTATAEQCAFITDHCEATVAVVENPDRVGQLDRARDRLRAIVLLEGEVDAEDCITWQELLAAGDDAAADELGRREAALDPDGVCTLIYTSGTTGAPKGVMLSHTNLVWTTDSVAREFGVDSSHRGISYLPLSHVAEQVLTLYAALVSGGCVAFAESLEAVADNLREIRPTFFFAVPRVWEKIQARMEAVGATSGPLKRRLARWARRVGLESGYAAQRGDPPVRGYGLANRLVFRKVRQKLGLDRAEFLITAAAPVALDTLEFFLSLDMPILEVYGMTECSGPGTFSRPDRYRTGAAGVAIPGTEVRLTEDGEVCMRGPHVFLGYYKDREATREALDHDGWLHSGDIGTIDDEGFLRVIDRKKELIITSGGKNVAPVPIELQLKKIPGIAQAVVVGDRRKCLAALLFLDPEGLPEMARGIGSPATTAAEAVDCTMVGEYLDREVEKVNANFAGYESIKKCAVLAEQLSVENDTLTPTLKLRRRDIAERYSREIEALFED